MRSDRWHAIEQLFSRAADLDPADRSTFLEAEARTPDGDPDLALREEVERLLALDASGGGLLDRPLVTPVAVPPEAGPWRLLERIGEGGMGEVWRAERADGAFEQTAAVKLARPGLAADIADRFRAERQILATLEHPAIARLLDGGSASDGRPYFALEFVDGEPITTYCDHHRLGVNERLALFVEACEAVAYAHARLVVHRDLKPSNVLVGTVGADADPAGATGGERSPRVRLLDFGIAKLLVPDAEQTQTGRQLMTPAYAAPEQRHGGSVTTAADVYALGVLLYELLSGSRPDADVPTRPSEAVTTSMATGGRLPPDPAGGPSVVGRPAGGATPGADASSLRSTTSERLARRLRGDLDTICLKALRADPDRRYRSAAELAADVQRHLDGLPVEARPESASYRVGKFVRRHAAGTTAAVVALLAILGGAGVALWQAAEADRQRDRALAEATRAERVSGFVAGLFQDTNGLEANGDTITARQMLDRGLARLARLDDPAARGDLLIALSGIYSDLGQSEIADSAATQAVLAFRSAGDSTMVARAFRHLASVYVGAQAPQLASRAYRASLAARSEMAPDTSVAWAYTGLANAYVMLDSLDAAIEALDTAERILEDLAVEEGAWATQGVRAGILLRQDRYEEALALHAEVIRQLRQDTGPEAERRLASALNAYGYALRTAEAYDRALAAYRESLDLIERTDREGHRLRSTLLNNIAGAAFFAGNLDAAEGALRENLDLQEAHRPPGHWRIGSAAGALAMFYEENGRSAEAIPLLDRQLAIYATALGEDHIWTSGAGVRLATARLCAGETSRRDELSRALRPIEVARSAGEAIPGDVMRALTHAVDMLDAADEPMAASEVRRAMDS